jgi:hypothetical protein
MCLVDRHDPSSPLSPPVSPVPHEYNPLVLLRRSSREFDEAGGPANELEEVSRTLSGEVSSFVQARSWMASLADRVGHRLVLHDRECSNRICCHRQICAFSFAFIATPRRPCRRGLTIWLLDAALQLPEQDRADLDELALRTLCRATRVLSNQVVAKLEQLLPE